MESREEYKTESESAKEFLRDMADASAFYYQELQRANLPEWLAASLLRDWHVEQWKAAFSSDHK